MTRLRRVTPPPYDCAPDASLAHAAPHRTAAQVSSLAAKAQAAREYGQREYSNLEYFALDPRGGEAKPLTESGFVDAVMSGGTEKQRKRSSSFNRPSHRKGGANGRAVSTGRPGPRQQMAW